MLTESELVDCAGRALGWIDYPNDSAEQGDTWHMSAERAPFGPIMQKSSWNPLKSNGDCAAMEAALNINVSWLTSYVHVAIEHRWVTAEYSVHGGDKNKARRWASTVVAAALWKASK